MATTTQATLQQDEQDFGQAFNEPEADPIDIGEDEAFGLALPDDAGGDGEQAAVAIDSDDTMKTDAEAVNDEVAEEPAGDPAADPAVDAEGAEMPGADGAAQEPAAEDEMPTDPKELQRMKSWEGRLKARERELEAKAAELEALQGGKSEVTIGAETSELSDSPGEAVVELAAAVDSGEMTAEAAMKTLSDDFGPEFTKMLQVLVQAEASKLTGKVSGDVNSLVDAIRDDKARMHFEAIADAHPDFNELANSPDMVAYMESLEGDAKAKAMHAAEKGNARQVIGMFSDFKAWKQAQGAQDQDPAPVDEKPAVVEPAQQDDPAVDAAEGVRSTGMRLPEQPARSDDYESAWEKF